MKLSIVMPCYNERGTIREIVSRVLAADISPVDEKELLIVDDGSTDGTRDILEELARLPGVRVLLQLRNEGKGAAVARGLRSTGPTVGRVRSVGQRGINRRIPLNARDLSSEPGTHVGPTGRDRLRSPPLLTPPERCPGRTPRSAVPDPAGRAA